MICETNTPVPRRFEIFKGWVGGSRHTTKYHCQITMLEEDPFRWRVLVYYPGDKQEDIMTLIFHAIEGEEIESATARLAQRIRAIKIGRATNELLERVHEEEFSIEEDIPYVFH